MIKSTRFFTIALLLSIIALPFGCSDSTTKISQQGSKYIILGWNNLGMHCYDPDFSNLAILPPFNTLCAQVIKVGDNPEIITSGITIEYSFPDNTYSTGKSGSPDKSNFWKYAQQLFNLDQPLPANIGLTGLGLTGTFGLAADGDYYTAVGIPLTDIRDSDAATQTIYPFQKAQIVVRDSVTKQVLATQTVVAPVSTELNCASCHADDGDATTGAMNPDHAIAPTGKVETNILALHDLLNGTLTENYEQKLAARSDLLAHTPLMENQPVLCADCHSDNALGMPGVPGISSLSNAMHGHHNPDNAPDIKPNTEGCYNCHPGATTQCLRCTMSQNYSLGCVDCHGEITAVALNTAPWLNEPTCGNTGCHSDGYGTQGVLYQKAMGHGGVYCEGCHDSTHSQAPSREANDAIKFINLQGHSGTLSDCATCHGTKPTQAFMHAQQLSAPGG